MSRSDFVYIYSFGLYNSEGHVILNRAPSAMREYIRLYQSYAPYTFKPIKAYSNNPHFLFATYTKNKKATVRVTVALALTKYVQDYASAVSVSASWPLASFSASSAVGKDDAARAAFFSSTRRTDSDMMP